jgi:hypothetical protein
MFARRYLLVSGLVLFALGLVGIFAREGYIGFEPVGIQPWLYIVSGLGALWTWMRRKGAEKACRFIGVFFTALGVLGILIPELLSLLQLDNGVAANVIHILVGLWGIWAGYLSGEQKTAEQPVSG